MKTNKINDENKNKVFFHCCLTCKCDDGTVIMLWGLFLLLFFEVFTI